MKYVMLADPVSGMESPVFGVAPMHHRDIAEAFWKMKPVSAGFCRLLPDGRAETFGRSISLGLRPRPEDAMLIGATVKSTAEMGETS